MKPLPWCAGAFLRVLWLGPSCMLACGGGQRFETGEEEPVIVEGGTFVRAPLPHHADGPKVIAAYLATNTFPERTQDKSFSGVLSEDATSALITLAPSAGVANHGYFIVPAEPPRPDAPGLPSFHAPLSFSADLLPGPYELLVAATDRQGRTGDPREIALVLSPRPRPTGELVFSLDWDEDADLDIHVVTPDGGEIFESDVRVDVTSGSNTSTGALDFDSNGECRVDGRRNENVIFETNPVSGRYKVRVDTFSLCGHEVTRWRVTALLRGEIIGEASGVSLPTDASYEHGRGAGLTALDLTITLEPGD